jgi:hypothetical protein
MQEPSLHRQRKDSKIFEKLKRDQQEDIETDTPLHSLIILFPSGKRQQHRIV